MNVSRALPRRTPRRPPIPRGFSLIELMIGMTIALVISLVMFRTLLFVEGQRRSTGGGADVQQSGSLASYTIERYIRMGGAGFERAHNLWGMCALSAKNSTGTVLLPLGAGLPAPFNGLSSLTLRYAPVFIANASTTSNDSATDITPDALITLAGTSPNVNTWFQSAVTPSTSTTAHMINTVGMATNDIIMAIEQTPGAANYGSSGLCRMAQVTSSIETNATLPNYRQTQDSLGRVVTVGGALTASDGLAPNGNVYTGFSEYVDLGNNPLLQIFAVGPTLASGNELRSYNILDGTVSSLSDGVVNLQAAYGLSDAVKSAANPCQVTSWVPPTGNFSISKLTDGTATAITNVQRICAIRIGLIVRSPLQEKNAVDAPASWTLFADDPNLAVTGTRTGNDLKYRYRQYDVIVPIRNQLN